MRVLEILCGLAIGFVTLLLLLIAILFSFPSMGKYVKNKNM